MPTKGRALATVALFLRAAVLVAVMAHAAAAQPETALLTGTVRGQDGSRLPGVTVTIDHKVSGLHRTTITDDDGHYVLALPVDRGYVVQVAVPGFAGVTTENVSLTRDGTLVDFGLKLTLLETVAVAATAPFQPETQSSLQ